MKYQYDPSLDGKSISEVCAHLRKQASTKELEYHYGTGHIEVIEKDGSHYQVRSKLRLVNGERVLQWTFSY